ncbi:MAG TPA: hypothetical protein VNR39_00390 [Pseudolabrys sp.]|nr:hypothetical protein [Pseudolabrys sp.]
MYQMATKVLGLAALLFAAAFAPSTAQAGEYYRDGYGYRTGNVSYSSNCCYRKVVRYVRKVSYVRVDDGYRDGYYAPRYRSSYYYGSPYRRAAYSEPYYRPAVYSEPYRRPYYDARPARYDGTYYDGYRPYRVSYGDNCTVRRIRVSDGYGGWVWARSRVCY